MSVKGFSVDLVVFCVYIVVFYCEGWKSCVEINGGPEKCIYMEAKNAIEQPI